MYYEILPMDHAQRLAIPGMIEMRADMIVVALIPDRFRLQNTGSNTSGFRLTPKEGMLRQMLTMKTA